MTITTVGIDLAKNVFAVHGVDQNGRTVLVKPKVSRAALPGGSLDIDNYCMAGLLFEWVRPSQQGVLPRYKPFSGDLTLIG